MTETVQRAALEAYAKQVHPRGLAGIPALISMQMGLNDVPPAIAAIGAALASGEPIRLAVSGAGLDLAFVIE